MYTAFVNLEAGEIQIIRQYFPNAEFIPNIGEIKNKKEIKVISIFIYDRLSKKELDSFPSLRHIITRSTGYDHIDISECKKRGIKVYNIPDYGTESVAEFTILLMLALLRNFKTCAFALAQKAETNIKEFHGREANGKVLGIAGTGRIGAQIIKIANSLGMSVLAYSRTENGELVEKYGVKFVSLDELVKNSDIISLHLPLTKETGHIINKETISKMKKGVLLINTSRGGLIDIEALANGINNSQIGGAALDVVEAEELIAHESDVLQKDVNFSKLKQAFIGNVLLQKKNVIITPHIAYNTEEAIGRILEKTIFTIKEIEKGNKDPYNRVC